MNRRSFGLIVRLLAVGAAIYAFYSFRHMQQSPTAPKSGPIRVTVVPAKNICGWIVAEKVTEMSSLTSTDSVIKQAIESPGKDIALRGSEECQRMEQVNGKVFGEYKILFKRAD